MIGHQDKSQNRNVDRKGQNSDEVHPGAEIIRIPEPERILQMVCRHEIKLHRTRDIKRLPSADLHGPSDTNIALIFRGNKDFHTQSRAVSSIRKRFNANVLTPCLMILPQYEFHLFS